MMFGITNIVAYAMTCLVLILLPGPNSMLCMSIAGQYGAKAARKAIVGTFLGNGTLLLLSALGLGTLLQHYPFLFTGLKIIGASYLAFLGIKLLIQARKSWQINQSQTIAETPPKTELDTNALFKKALFVALLNPKGLLFFPAMMIQFVDVTYTNTALSFLILAMIFQTISLVYLNTVAPLASHISRFFSQHYRLGAMGKGSVGGLFLLFAAKLI